MKYLDNKKITAKAAEIEKEPMLFGCDWETASEFGGPITWKMMDYIPAEERSMVIIDTRVHMLKPGWFPAIPGWHLDNAPRGDDEQPIPDMTMAYHYGLTLDAEDQATGAMTEFLPEKRLPPNLPKTLTAEHRVRGFKTLWHLHDHLIRAHIATDMDIHRHLIKVISGLPYSFGPTDYHRATPANGSGWRYFFRASVGSKRDPINKLRRQTQVYLDPIMGGW